MIRRAKGLQFRAVAVIGVDRTTLPLASVAQRQTDDAARRASEEQERNLLYVACSRSRERLLVTCVREPSTFLDVLRLRGSQEQRVSEMRPNVDRADSATPQPAVRAHLEIVFVTSPDLFDMQPKERREAVVTPQHQGSLPIRQCRILAAVRTVAETSIFVKYAAEVWSPDECTEFINWIAAYPSAGDVNPGSGGCRKVRWSASGRGKRGGARVIYFLQAEHTSWLLIVYTKAKFDDLPTEFLAELKRGVEDAL